MIRQKVKCDMSMVMEYYAAINNEIRRFVGKLMSLETELQLSHLRILGNGRDSHISMKRTIELFILKEIDKNEI